MPNATHTSYLFSRAAFSASSCAVSVLIERERCSKRKGGPPFFRTLSSTSVWMKKGLDLGVGCFWGDVIKSKCAAHFSFGDSCIVQARYLQRLR